MSFLDGLFKGGIANPLTADLDAASHKITDLAAPTDPNDAARLADVGGGGSGARGREWWNSDSLDDGTLDGTGELFFGTFDAQIDRINLWDGGDGGVATLPTVGAGDHNRRCAFLEASGLEDNGLTINAAGTSTINAGAFQALAGIKVQGAGAFHVLQYDEFTDKWRVIHPANNSIELRELLTKPTIVTAALPDPSVDDLVISGIDVATHVHFVPANDFAEVTGIDASLVDLPGFCRTKIFYNFHDTNRLVLRNGNGASLSPNQFAGPINDRIVIQPRCAALVSYTDAWQVLEFGVRAVEVRRATVTGNATADVDGELMVVDATDPVIITPPDPLFTGQRFAVQLIAGTSLTVNGAEDPDTGLLFGGVIALRQFMRYEWRLVLDTFAWMLVQQPATTKLRALLDDAAGVLQGGALYISGAGALGLPKVTRAKADVLGTAKFFGAAALPAADTEPVHVQTDGVLYIPAASQVGTWNTGDKIYVDDTTAGKYTNSAPAIAIPVGWALDTPSASIARVVVDRSGESTGGGSADLGLAEFAPVGFEKSPLGIYVPNAPMRAVNAQDDYFRGGTIDSKWITVDPAGVLTSSIDKRKRMLKLAAAGSATVHFCGIMQPVPGSEWAIYTHAYQQYRLTAQGAFAGLWCAEGSPPGGTNKCHVGARLALTVYSIANSRDVSLITGGASTNSNLQGGPWPYYCMRVNGTTVAVDASAEGLDWFELYTGTLGFTPTYYGIVVEAGDATLVCTSFFDMFKTFSGAGSSVFGATEIGEYL